MQLVERQKAISVQLGETTVTTVLTTVISAVVAWLIASFSKASKGEVDALLKANAERHTAELARVREDFKEERRTLSERISRVETRGETFITRAEFKDAMDGLKDDIVRSLTDLKSEVIALRDHRLSK